MSYTFIKNSKHTVSLDRDSLLELLGNVSQEVTNLVNDASEFSQQTQVQYIDLLLKIAQALPEAKKRQQMFCIIGYLLSQNLSWPKVLKPFVEKFQNITAWPTLFRVKMSALLFKAVDNSEFKKELLINSIKVLSEENKILYLSSFLKDLDELLKGLNLSRPELAEVYLLVITSLESNPLYKDLTVQFTLKYLEIAAVTGELDRHFAYLLRYAVIDENVVLVAQNQHFKDLNSLTFKLFVLFLSGDLKAYQDLSTTESANISKLDIDLAQYLQKLKVQYIATLAQNKKSISYSQLAEALQIKKEEVQTYIIYAIQSSVVSASLDEFEEVVTFQAIKSKYFSFEEWGKIKTDLDKLCTKLQKFVAA